MSFLFQVVLALHACLLVSTVHSAPATYDQRQTGDFNVRIDLKDLKILAFVDSKILEDYTDYDYFYDYADFTVKPTTSKSTTVSDEPLDTWPTNPPTSSSTTDKISSEESVSSANDSTTIVSLSSVQNTVTTLKSEISTDKPESSSSIEGIVEPSKSSLSRGNTKWRSNNPLNFFFQRS